MGAGEGSSAASARAVDRRAAGRELFVVSSGSEIASGREGDVREAEAGVERAGGGALCRSGGRRKVRPQPGQVTSPSG